MAPNIYYLGAAGVVQFGGLRIAGLSGIFNPRHYRLVCDSQLAAGAWCVTPGTTQQAAQRGMLDDG